MDVESDPSGFSTPPKGQKRPVVGPEGVAKLVPFPYDTEKPAGWTRFVCFSDTHGKHNEIPDAHRPSADVLLHGGDFSNTGEVEQVKSFAKWLQEYPASERIVIAGNHDVTFQPDFYKGNWQRFHGLRGTPYDCQAARQPLLDPNSCTYLEDEQVEVFGYRIYGSPWQPEFCDWAFNLPRGGCHVAWDKIPSAVDVLIAHGPAHGMRDQCSSGLNAGCAQLLQAVRSRQVPVLVGGHIHEGYGCVYEGPTLFANASTCNLAYRPVNPPIVFDLPPVAELRQAAQALADTDESGLLEFELPEFGNRHDRYLGPCKT